MFGTGLSEHHPRFLDLVTILILYIFVYARIVLLQVRSFKWSKLCFRLIGGRSVEKNL